MVNFSLFDGLKASVLVRAFRVCVEIEVSIVRFFNLPERASCVDSGFFRSFADKWLLFWWSLLLRLFFPGGDVNLIKWPVFTSGGLVV